MTPQDTETKGVRRALLRSSSTPRAKIQTFVHRGRTWTIKKMEQPVVYYMLTLENDDFFRLAARGYLLKEEMEAAPTVPYLIWDGKDIPSVQSILMLADLILAHELMDG